MYLRKINLALLPIVLISIAHFVVFYEYYLGKFGFPWDFNIGYFGYIAYWTTSVRLGIFPDWIPFAGSGYPILLNPQSYFSYPVFWLTILFNIHYSMHVAVIVQCLHFLAGAIGSYAFTYSLSRDKQIGIFFGIAYIFFGGFFSHAEHPDIVRGYTILPWILWATSFNAEIRLLKRHLLIPFFVSLLCTGSYPGVIAASLFITGLIVTLNFIFLPGSNKCKYFVLIMFAYLLGLLIAVSHLGPIFSFADHLMRAYGETAVPRGGWKLSSLVTLISGWESNLLPEDISMRGLYLGSATLFIIFLLSKPFSRPALSYAIAFLITIFMIQGDQSPLYQAITAILSPLRQSRFPSADYKALIHLTLFGVCASTASLGLELKNKTILIRILYLAICLSLILFFSPIRLNAIELTLLLSSVVMLSAFVLLFKKNLLGFIYIAILFNFIGGFILINQNKTSWQIELPDYTSLLDPTSGEFKVVYKIYSPPVTRPERLSEQNSTLESSFLGYLLGDYYFNDYTGFRLKSKSELEKKKPLKNFILEPWKGILTTNPNINCDSPFSSNDTTIGNIIQTSYSADEASFVLNANKQVYFIENETFFPGWKAIWSEQESTDSIPFCNSLRGYILPAGNYQFKTKFEFPQRSLFFGITGISCIAYIFLIVLILRKKWVI